jgi:hypothetical protein
MNEPVKAPSKASDSNRRECFRINDRIGLALKVLTEAEFKWTKQRSKDARSRQMAVNGLLVETDAQKSILRKLRNQQPLLVDYLESIEARLSMLARALQSESSEAPNAPTHDVNISGTGLRFHHTERLPKGTRLLLDMQLFPSRTCLRLAATVVWAESTRNRAKADRVAIAVDYSDVPEHDRELLIRHVHDLQMDYVRRGVRRD